MIFRSEDGRITELDEGVINLSTIDQGSFEVEGLTEGQTVEWECAEKISEDGYDSTVVHIATGGKFYPHVGERRATATVRDENGRTETLEFTLSVTGSGVTDLTVYWKGAPVSEDNPVYLNGSEEKQLTVKGVKDGVLIDVPTQALETSAEGEGHVSSSANALSIGAQNGAADGESYIYTVALKEDGDVSASFKAVHVEVAVTGIIVNCPEVFYIDRWNGLGGQYGGLTAHGQDGARYEVEILPANASNKSVSWVSHDKDVAWYQAAYNNGIVPKKAGKASFTVMSDASPAVSAEVEIEFRYKTPLESASSSQEHYELKQYDSIELDLDVAPADATEQRFTWSYSQSGIVSVTDAVQGSGNSDRKKTTTHTLTALSSGTVTVTGTPADDTNSPAPVTFTVTVKESASKPVIDEDKYVTQNKIHAREYMKKQLEGNYAFESEWAIFTVLRTGGTLSESDLEDYCDDLERELQSGSRLAPTDYFRIIMTLQTMGEDPENFRGINVLEKTYNFPNLENYTSNMITFTLLAYDSGNFAIPGDALWQREDLVAMLLAFQNESNGGFGLVDDATVSVDVTAMTLQALAPFATMKKCVSVRQINGARNEGGSFMRKKSFKSALTVLLSLMMILVMFPANAFAMDGEGTTADPYIIATADDLYEFAIKVNEGDNTACAVLTADITLPIDKNWTPIGKDKDHMYNGTFDGDGHTITGLSVDIQSDNTIYAGLFGFLGEGGTIKNLGLADSKITCSGNRVYAGGVCGWNTGTIQNCYNTGDVSGTSEYGFVYAGGVCGLNDYGTIENCYNTGDVSGTCEYGFVYAGGVCGCNDYGTIENCYNTGDVSGTSEYGFVYAGGVCGLNDYGTIENCYNTGDVSGTGTRTDASGHAGGVCGCNDYGTIENCYNTGEVSGIYGFVYAGGVCGFNGGTIENCYNTGDVSGTSTVGSGYAGGVCGANGNSATIINCYNTGDVSGTSSNGTVYAGGVCGRNYYGTIQNCYNTGDVSGEATDSDGCAYVGGVCGFNDVTIQNCYFLFGTADKAVSINSGTVDNVEEKSAEAFASGEVAWLLNEPQTEKPWGQGSNGMPVLKGNLPDGVTSKTPVRITIVMQDNSEQYRYTTEGSTVAEYPTGYAFFFKDGDTKTWINKGTRTYDADATIYAENMTLEKIPEKAATCTADGHSAYWYCAAFDKYFSDENGVNEITAKDTVIPATGHGEAEVKGAKEATCTEDGYTGDKACKVCGEILERGTVIEKIGHVWGEPEWNWSEDGKTCTVTFTCKNNPEHKETPEADVTSEVKTPATCTESGVTTYTAKVDFNGSTYTDTKEVSVPATGHELKKTDAKEPTCTEDGNKEYWTCDTCDKYFSDENAETEIQLADTVIEATGHSYDNGKCTVCGEIDPDFKAVIIEGANGTWQKGTKDGLSFTSNATFADFQKVQVDGKDLDASNYTVKEGSTIVTLNAEYLETLSVGKHTLAIVSETGTAETEFTIKAAPASDDTQSPQTGDNSNMMLWIALMLIAVCGLTGAMVYGQKKKYGK